ncbi:MAG: hypothetical protein K9I59_02290 [Chlorobium sp.]|jgi:hypothetical protein|uniref:hypothetical protein n=1 Tax=Chlorobium sp. TaxID=1095 RepID=UPI001D8EA5F9|nr:hypothetical protein [Chlorobium sp.]MBN1279206.1 hypothetical protein [Chlorobiaceae bacterium]MCF8215683.1 hypothetical protein [Chlorobium sp.]MCF8270583.1 hypothetical protein [Chlorobium sp.]MCF8286892.1 hypothetical protein [Chlorobium sp.]MCF8290488.1 hypothetical protein [Chlorobium sp.]
MGEKQIQEGERVIVTDIRMPFWSMVVFMIKWVFASIPAVIILAIIMSALAFVAVALTGSIWSAESFFEHGGSSF